MIRHSISLARHARRTLDVQVELELPAGTRTQDVAFPVWTPGSYLVREHERHVHDVRARAGGKPATVEKVTKNVYRVATAGARRLVLTFEVYAHELTVRTSHVDGSHAFFNPVNFLPYLPGREAERQRVEVVDVPKGWGVATALPADRTGFVARDYDELADSPFECGPHALPKNRAVFTALGVRHEIVHWGRSALDLPTFARDCRRIVEAQGAMFGGLPYERFVFIVHASDAGRGGLEHRASTALLYPRNLPLKPDGYADLLSLASHELFHAWNVKRIKPAAFTPYDLSRENHTRLLWAFEGLTSYYEDIFLVRAGFLTRESLLESFSERLTALERTPGRARHSVEQASWDAWIRYYRQDENSDNSSVSYYLKGSLIGLLLDLELRRASKGERSLDDVMRLLWKQYGRTGVGVPEDGVEAACVEIGGRRVKALFDAAVRGTGDLPLAIALEAHGLRVVRRRAGAADDRGQLAAPGTPARCEVGFTTKADGDRVKVGVVRRDSPAEAAGLCPGDELVAIDGLRADAGSAFQRLHAHEPGTSITLSVFRRDELHELSVRAEPPPSDICTLQEDPGASAEAKRLREAWAASGNG